MADMRIQATDLLTGNNHPTRPDTLNKLTLVEHNSDGTHKQLTGLELVSPVITGTLTVPTTVNPTDAASKSYADNLAMLAALPSGGTLGQVPKVTDESPYTIEWANETAQSDSARTYTSPKYTRDDDGTVSGGTWAIDYANGPVIKATAGANITSITMANWPTTGTAGHLRLMLVNFGAYTITFPAWNWIKSDLTVSTTFSDLGLTLPASGTCIVDLFSDDGGTTIYASVVR